MLSNQAVVACPATWGSTAVNLQLTRPKVTLFGSPALAEKQAGGRGRPLDGNITALPLPVTPPASFLSSRRRFL